VEVGLYQAMMVDRFSVVDIWAGFRKEVEDLL
jgi:hypothetical protein